VEVLVDEVFVVELFVDVVLAVEVFVVFVEEVFIEDDFAELVVGLAELDEEERAEVCSVETTEEERALGQIPKSDLQPAPQ
jgi:hypothetical protein